MKRCPACSRVYDDDGLRFCLDDGANLVDKFPSEPVPQTLVLPATDAPQPTIKQTQPPDVPPLHDARPRSTVAVVLNDEVRSIAYIRSQISDQGVINGRFTKQSAEDLALVLKSGGLPTPVKIVDERVDK